MPALTWDIDPIWFRVGVLGIRYYSLLFTASLLGGYGLLLWQIRRGGGDVEEAGDFISYGVIGALVGGRLGHVIFYDLDKALQDPNWVLKIWTGGLAGHGAMVGVAIAMYLFTRRRGMPVTEGLDRLTFAAALAAILSRVANFMNSEIVGLPTNSDWGVRFPRFFGDRMVAEVPLRHPTQLYEALLGLVVFGLLVFFDRRWGREERSRGAMTGLFLAAYFTGRFFVEYLKEYQVLDPSSALTMGQWLSIPGALIGYALLGYSTTHYRRVGWLLPRKPRRRRSDMATSGQS